VWSPKIFLCQNRRFRDGLLGTSQDVILAMVSPPGGRILGLSITRSSLVRDEVPAIDLAKQRHFPDRAALVRQLIFLRSAVVRH
jgi:hypothetical protein